MADRANLEFEWDPDKAAANATKHRVSFPEAATVFDDPYAVITFDEPHSDDEVRQIATGLSNRNRVLFVAFMERRPNRIRIISARKTTPAERKKYEQIS